MVVDEAFAEVLVVGHQAFGVDGEIVFLDDADGGDDAGDDDEEQDEVDRGLGQAVLRLSRGFDDGEPEIFHGDESGQGDEDAVDEEEVERTEDDGAFPDGDAVAHGAERRHEGCGDGHASDNAALVLARGLDDARQAAEEGDEHVVDGGSGSSQQLRRVGQTQGTEEEEDGRGQNADDDHHAVVLQGVFHQIGVFGAQTQAKAQDGTHHGRDQHGADDDGDGVDVQAHRGDDDGAGQDKDVGAFEGDILADRGAGVLVVDLVGEMDELFQVGQHPTEKVFHG